MDLARRLAAFAQADLYVVITEAFCGGRTSLTVLDQVLAAGVGIVQLREKDLEGRRLYELAVEFRRRTEATGALLIIDDRLDIALAAAAPTGSTWARRTSPWPRPVRIAPGPDHRRLHPFPGRGPGGPKRWGRIRQHRPDFRHSHQASRHSFRRCDHSNHRGASEDSLERHGGHQPGQTSPR